MGALPVVPRSHPLKPRETGVAVLCADEQTEVGGGKNNLSRVVQLVSSKARVVILVFIIPKTVCFLPYAPLHHP